MQRVLDTLQDLPVNAILDDILAHTETGGIAIVNSEPASGKTLLVPTVLSTVVDETVLILEPRRLLVVNAAETLCDISKTVLGDAIGYVVGGRGRETESYYDPANNKLVFTTYGYGLATMEILTADVIVLDEMHETSMDITVCKALIKQRLQSGKPIKRLVLMSATLDAEAEMAYWAEFNPKVFSAETGVRFTATRHWEPATPVQQAALNLVQQGRKGVLVFVPGVPEIQEAEKQLRELLLQVDDVTVEIATIHGQSDYEVRRAAVAAPAEGVAKILIGTNVLESGMNLAWVDAGVSAGTCKELDVARESGAISLRTVPLARSNVDQQAGRTNRFQDSIFILCGQNRYEDMAPMPAPEIVRLPLTMLYMHCAGIEVNPKDLEFLPQPDADKLRDAEKTLWRLGFLDEARKLTEDGRFVQRLPVGLETAALLCHARKLGILADALVAAAVFENRWVRKDLTRPHGYDPTSDLFDGAMAFAVARTSQRISREQRIAVMEEANVGKRRFDDTWEILDSLERALNVTANVWAYLPSTRPTVAKLFGRLRQCVLAASVNNIGHWDSLGALHMNGDYLTRYPASNGTIVPYPVESIAITATLRRITPKNKGASFVIAEGITCFHRNDFEEFDRLRPGVFRFDNDRYHDRISAFGRVVFRKPRPWAVSAPDTERWSDDGSVSLGTILQAAKDSRRPMLERVYPEPIPTRSTMPLLVVDPGATDDSTVLVDVQDGVIATVTQLPPARPKLSLNKAPAPERATTPTRAALEALQARFRG